MCSCYEVHVPENYTALSGDLEVTIIGLRRKSSEEIRLELLEVEFVRSENQEFRKRTATDAGDPSRKARGAAWNVTSLDDFLDPIVPNETDSEEDSRQRIKLESLSRVFEDNENQIPQIKVSRKWTVLGSVVVPFSGPNGTDLVQVKFPCGVITKGGQFGVRLKSIDQELNNLTWKHRGFKQSKVDPAIAVEVSPILCDLSEFLFLRAYIDHFFSTHTVYQPSLIHKLLVLTFQEGSSMSIIGLDVRWPRCVLSISPRHVETYPKVTVTATLQFLPTTCPPAVGAPLPEMWLDLLSCGHSPVGCTEANSTHRKVALIFNCLDEKESLEKLSQS